MTLVFLTLIYAFRHVRRLTLCFALLGVIAISMRYVGYYWQLSNLEMLSHGSSFVAMVLAMIEMLSEVLHARAASTDVVIGAVCLYLVIGMAWTFLYYSIYLFSPGSIFVSPGSAPFSALASEAKFTEVFFSFSALTTIGSSGEEALTTMARQLAVVESAMGRLYLAVLISRLVGFSITGNTKASS